MQRGSRQLYAVNKSIGHRWSAIPEPPPPHMDRLCGTHSVLNALRAFYNAVGCRHPHRQKLHCLFVRDFRLALGDAKAYDTSHSHEEEDGERKEGKEGDSHGDVWVPHQYPKIQRIVRLARAMRLDIKAVERRELVRLCGERRNQNVVLEVAGYTPWDVAACPWPSGGRNASAHGNNGHDNKGRSGHSGGGGGDNVLFLDHVIDPGNVGAIMRSAFFLGVRCVVLSCDSAGCTAAMARASAGVMEHMAVYRSVVPTTTFLENTIAQHRARGDPCSLEMYAAITMPMDAIMRSGRQAKGETEKGGEPMRRRLLLLGNEDRGLPPEVVRLCSHAVHIPSPWMQQYERRWLHHADTTATKGNCAKGKNGVVLEDDVVLLRPQEVSLNVSAASAIILATLLAGDRVVEIHRIG
ncbi:hypothetical protein C3747_54g153 [Trypanosoma cruzi]|uniref:tRNA/rRNA methyltransferase SpoU type domain-containing protein n=2 Tax=Trypanosoma cruzi TaxID=5693 RepID=Q4E2X5_TRYCC|nr:hypothetical protein, conserved [Trypanosoma cruzi]EAN99125.1 hypothetical protein, conserved [Trypanosoma cruzi]PWV12094.1 hypothetical protein C3747_54g153 [Trypanosoma cruzi]RNC45331.1 putative RNA methyltransferase [Trypanosoma cruzi]|eukprot:XP_820976.1 hypothetical protein [Trypanosoma cruzi strain CL Brener]